MTAPEPRLSAPDIAYFDFEGSMCVLWMPLEHNSRENGIAFVRGSHLWDRPISRPGPRISI